MDTERTANNQYCFILINLSLDHLCKSIFNNIYIVLQLFYTLSGCTYKIPDRFVTYEKNKFSTEIHTPIYFVSDVCFLQFLWRTKQTRRRKRN